MTDPTSIGGIRDRTKLQQLVDMVQGLRREVKELRTARSNAYANVTTGALRVSGGNLVVVDPTTGHVIYTAGALQTGDGLPATGQILYRNDGTPMLIAYSAAGNIGFLAYYDRARNYIITDDATAGQGLARPYIPFSQFSDNTAPTATTTLGSWTTLQTTVGYKQHPKITMQVLVQAQSAGQVRCVDQDGNQIGATQTFTVGAFEYRTIQGVIGGSHMLPISLNLQARLTSGSSPIGVRGVAAWGVESAAF